ncbi:MAG: short-chain dehydrogenase [Actinomycetales bacterium mxb001]|nr:MAG: short-chain dehydrogenase [Actinomycetales bacterium mxb001]
MSDTPVALVTGAAGGVGGAVSARFAAGGWRVIGTDRPGTRADADAWIPADLLDVDQIREMVAQASATFGRIDCVVNCAGLWTEGRAEDTSEDEWDRVVGVNLKALYFVTSAAIPHLIEASGSVVNISSDAGLQGNAGAAVYSASKGGVSNLTRALALELAPRGVRVNAVCPGDVESPMLLGQARDFGGDDPEGYLRRLLDGYAQKGRARFIRPNEVAEVVWFLAQPEAAAITGANWSIDFGLSAGI